MQQAVAVAAQQQNRVPEERHNKGYITIKNLVPKQFGEKLEEWRVWKEDFEDYLDVSNPGMKGYLKMIANLGEEIPAGWHEEQKTEFGDRVVQDQVQVWRALKNLTTSEARKVVMAVKGEDGFKVWQKLH